MGIIYISTYYPVCPCTKFVTQVLATEYDEQYQVVDRLESIETQLKRRSWPTITGTTVVGICAKLKYALTMVYGNQHLLT